MVTEARGNRGGYPENPRNSAGIAGLVTDSPPLGGACVTTPVTEGAGSDEDKGKRRAMSTVEANATNPEEAKDPIEPKACEYAGCLGEVYALMRCRSHYMHARRHPEGVTLAQLVGLSATSHNDLVTVMGETGASADQVIRQALGLLAQARRIGGAA